MGVFKDESLEAEFQEAGYVLLDLLGPSEVEVLARIDREYPPPGPAKGFVAGMLLDDRAYRRAIDARIKSVLREPVDSVLDDYRLIHGTFTIKRPAGADDDGVVGMHQDPTFVDERRHTSVTLWCPLIDVVPENGCLYVVRGSHRFNRCLRANGFFPYRELQDLLMSRYLTYLPMRAGQVLLMHPGTFHGSPRNLTDRTRVAAGGVAVPRDCPLIYCHRRPSSGQDPDRLEIYDVDDGFYLDHVLGRRPAGARLIGLTRFRFEPLSPDQLEASCGHASA